MRIKYSGLGSNLEKIMFEEFEKNEKTLYVFENSATYYELNRKLLQENSVNIVNNEIIDNNEASSVDKIDKKSEWKLPFFKNFELMKNYDFCEKIFTTDKVVIREEKQVVLFFNSLTKKIKNKLNISNYYDIIDIAYNYYNLFDELQEYKIDLNAIKLEKWQEESFANLMEIDKEIKKMVEKKNLILPYMLRDLKNVEDNFVKKYDKICFVNKVKFTPFERELIEYIEKLGVKVENILQLNENDFDEEKLEIVDSFSLPEKKVSNENIDIRIFEYNNKFSELLGVIDKLENKETLTENILNKTNNINDILYSSSDNDKNNVKSLDNSEIKKEEKEEEKQEKNENENVKINNEKIFYKIFDAQENDLEAKIDYQLLSQKKLATNLEITMKDTKIYKVLNLICNILENVKVIHRRKNEDELIENENINIKKAEYLQFRIKDLFDAFKSRDFLKLSFGDLVEENQNDNTLAGKSTNTSNNKLKTAYSFFEELVERDYKYISVKELLRLRNEKIEKSTENITKNNQKENNDLIKNNKISVEIENIEKLINFIQKLEDIYYYNSFGLNEFYKNSNSVIIKNHELGDTNNLLDNSNEMITQKSVFSNNVLTDSEKENQKENKNKPKNLIEFLEKIIIDNQENLKISDDVKNKYFEALSEMVVLEDFEFDNLWEDFFGENVSASLLKLFLKYLDKKAISLNLEEATEIENRNTINSFSKISEMSKENLIIMNLQDNFPKVKVNNYLFSQVQRAKMGLPTNDTEKKIEIFKFYQNILSSQNVILLYVKNLDSDTDSASVIEEISLRYGIPITKNEITESDEMYFIKNYFEKNDSENKNQERKIGEFIQSKLEKDLDKLNSENLRLSYYKFKSMRDFEYGYYLNEMLKNQEVEEIEDTIDSKIFGTVIHSFYENLVLDGKKEIENKNYEFDDDKIADILNKVLASYEYKLPKEYIEFYKKVSFEEIVKSAKKFLKQLILELSDKENIEIKLEERIKIKSDAEIIENTFINGVTDLHITTDGKEYLFDYKSGKLKDNYGNYNKVKTNDALQQLDYYSMIIGNENIEKMVVEVWDGDIVPNERAENDILTKEQIVEVIERYRNEKFYSLGEKNVVNNYDYKKYSKICRREDEKI